MKPSFSRFQFCSNLGRVLESLIMDFFSYPRSKDAAESESANRLHAFPLSQLTRIILTTFLLGLLLMKVVQNYIHQRLKKQHKNVRKDKIIITDFHSIPGPKGCPIKFIGNLVNVMKPDFYKTCQEFAKKYGDIYRVTAFGEDYVVLNSPQYAQALLSSNDIGHLGKGGVEKLVWTPDIHSLVTMTGDEWKVRRKILNRTFTYSSLQEYNNNFNKGSTALVSELEDMFLDGKAHEVDAVLSRAVCRLSSAALMGVELSNDEIAVFCEATEIVQKAGLTRMSQPWLMIDWIWRLHPQYRKDLKAKYRMKAITDKIVRMHRESMSTLDDKEKENQSQTVSGNMINVMLHNGLTDWEMFQEIGTLLAIAHDITSLMLNYALFSLAIHPQHQQVCREEITTLFNDSEKCVNGTLTFHALTELKNLERCILESLRMYPATAIMRKLETPLKLSENLTLPAGVNAFICGKVLHFNENVYPHPELFDPDRFLPEQVKARNTYAYIPFAGGPRNCIGMKLALIEMKIVLGKLMYHFDIETSTKKEDLKFGYNPMKPIKPIQFIFKKRNV